MSRALIQKGGGGVEPKKPGLSKREVMLCHLSSTIMGHATSRRRS